ncbi:MAG: hypothetical protein ACXADW_16665 [Candidatus Hodarchaeales archaeon]
MVEIKRLDKDVPSCAECSKYAHRMYKVRVACVEFIICHKCLSDLKYACFPHTRWP